MCFPIAGGCLFQSQTEVMSDRLWITGQRTTLRYEEHTLLLTVSSLPCKLTPDCQGQVSLVALSCSHICTCRCLLCVWGGAGHNRPEMEHWDSAWLWARHWHQRKSELGHSFSFLVEKSECSPKCGGADLWSYNPTLEGKGRPETRGPWEPGSEKERQQHRNVGSGRGAVVFSLCISLSVCLSVCPSLFLSKVDLDPWQILHCQKSFKM